MTSPSRSSSETDEGIQSPWIQPCGSADHEDPLAGFFPLAVFLARSSAFVWSFAIPAVVDESERGGAASEWAEQKGQGGRG